MTKDNLLKRTGKGIALATAGLVGLAGVANGGTKEDLDAVRNYVKTNPTIEGIQGDAKLYGSRLGNILASTAGTATWFKLTGDGIAYFFCDNDSDGELDGFEKAGNSVGDMGFAELDCLTSYGNNSKQHLYNGIVNEFKDRARKQ